MAKILRALQETHMFETLTKEEKQELQRTLRWVLVATQVSDAHRETILKTIDLLEEEEPIGPGAVQ